MHSNLWFFFYQLHSSFHDYFLKLGLRRVRISYVLTTTTTTTKKQQLQQQQQKQQLQQQNSANIDKFRKVFKFFLKRFIPKKDKLTSYSVSQGLRISGFRSRHQIHSAKFDLCKSPDEFFFEVQIIVSSIHRVLLYSK